MFIFETPKISNFLPYYAGLLAALKDFLPDMHISMFKLIVLNSREPPTGVKTVKTKSRRPRLERLRALTLLYKAGTFLIRV